MYDSTAAADIPLDSDLVAGYVDGSFAWSIADWSRFPGKTLVRVCIFANRLDAHVIDVEAGNNDAAGAVPWIRAKWEIGQTPTVYCYTDRGPAGYRISDVRAACDAAGVPHPLFLVADYDNVPMIPAGCIGKQYANATYTGGHFDASVVADHWPGVDEMSQAEVDAINQHTDAKFLELYSVIEAVARRQLRGAEPFAPGHDAPIVTGEQINPSNAR